MVDSLACRARNSVKPNGGSGRQNGVYLGEFLFSEVIFSAPTFSSKYRQRLVPGIGTMSFPCAKTQAKAKLSWRAALMRKPVP